MYTKYKRMFNWSVFLALVMAMVLVGIAIASDVDVAVVDVTVPTNSVTLTPGASSSITINMSVTGNQVGTATFEVYRDWTISNGTFTGSNPQEFTVGPRAGGDPATTFSTSGTVTIAAGQATGTFTLAVGAFDITNTNTTGAKLAAGDPSNYQVTVSAPSDSTAPVITPNVSGTLGNNGWYVSDVTVSWSVVDSESAISSSSGCNPTTINADTAGTTLTCTATSAGGTASESVTIKRDATAPTISGTASPSPNSFGWNNTDVTVTWNCSDSGSGVVAASVSQTVTTEEANQAATGTCVDNAGNEASDTVTGINIDKTKPTISVAATTSPNDAGWYNTNVTVQFTCEDELSGIPAETCPANQILSAEGEAVSSTAQTVTDAAGNVSEMSNVVTVKIDKTAPAVSVTGVANAATYILGSVPEAGCFTTDVLSGVHSFATLSLAGGPVGTITATCSGALDNADNSGSASATYYVHYDWDGFFAPVDNLQAMNVVKAGSAIPVKFSLGGDQGLDIFATGYPKSYKIACETNASLDSIEETVTAGYSSLQYDATAGRYIYVWKTDKSWVGTCRMFNMILDDETPHEFKVYFKK